MSDVQVHGKIAAPAALARRFFQIISDLLDELPEEFYRDLTGGVIMSEALVIPDYARNNDLYTLGQYLTACQPQGFYFTFVSPMLL